MLLSSVRAPCPLARLYRERLRLAGSPLRKYQLYYWFVSPWRVLFLKKYRPEVNNRPFKEWGAQPIPLGGRTFVVLTLRRTGLECSFPPVQNEYLFLFGFWEDPRILFGWGVFSRPRANTKCGPTVIRPGGNLEFTTGRLASLKGPS